MAVILPTLLRVVNKTLLQPFGYSSFYVGTFSKSPDSDSSGSTSSDGVATPHYQHAGPSRAIMTESYAPADETDTTSEDDTEDEAHELPTVHIESTMSQANRPQSSLSSHRYRTPMAGSLAMSPPPLHGVPAAQPLPVFETPSAFAEPSPVSVPTSLYPATSSYVGQFSESSRGELTSPPHIYPAHPSYRGRTQSRQYGSVRPASRPTLERAVENVQAHLAALTERLESLESGSGQPTRSHVSLSPRAIGSPPWVAGRGSPADGRDRLEWDLDDLGMWSLVLNPLSRGLTTLRELATFFAQQENRSPTLIIVRRLCLDVSFLLCVLAVIRALWKKSGVRRREVHAALVVLWRAILGTKRERTMMDRGV